MPCWRLDVISDVVLVQRSSELQAEVDTNREGRHQGQVKEKHKGLLEVEVVAGGRLTSIQKGAQQRWERGNRANTCDKIEECEQWLILSTSGSSEAQGQGSM